MKTEKTIKDLWILQLLLLIMFILLVTMFFLAFGIIMNFTENIDNYVIIANNSLECAYNGVNLTNCSK